ncbi:MAG: hypothetical protein IPG72_04340 [Ardenticatenales bacterium]|nr:hypothetical protein [Ardenticatenales bacterium]
MMRTTVTIDDADMRFMLRETRLKSQPAVIRAAVQAFVRQLKLKRVLALEGSMIVDEEAIADQNRVDLEDAERTAALWDE